MENASDTCRASKSGTPRRGLTGRLRGMLSDRLVRNIGWYGLAELANRLTRLVTAIVLARSLFPADFGIAATAIVVFEIISVLAMNGIGQAVVRASDEELPAVINTARRASWVVCLSAFALQLAVGYGLSIYNGRPDLFWMIACLAGVFLTLPFGQMQAHLIVRANRLHVLAGIAVVQVAVDNILTAVLAFCGFGAWAVILPKLLTAPIWVIGMRRSQREMPARSAGYAPVVPLARFAAAVIASELLVAARFNLDKVLVGSILGLEALGIYYFVFSAGIGFSLSLTNALSASVYPHLTEMAAQPRAMLARYDGMIWRAVLPCASVIALQAAMAPLYVPLVFGERWAPYAYLVAILCGSAIAKPLFDSACQLLRAVGRPRLEFYASAGLTVVALGAMAAALPFGLALGVEAFAGATAVTQLAVALAVRNWLGQRHGLASNATSAEFHVTSTSPASTAGATVALQPSNLTVSP
jgi:PST family polysaccharide transporter